jgi:hypothetical protein
LLSEQLLELVDVESGRPAVASVDATAGRFARNWLDTLPDLVVTWRDDAPLTRVWSPRLGQVATTGHWRSGDHRDEGLLLVAGSGLRAGVRPAVTMADIASSVAASIGVPLDDADGCVRRDLLPSRAASMVGGTGGR